MKPGDGSPTEQAACAAIGPERLLGRTIRIDALGDVIGNEFDDDVDQRLIVGLDRRVADVCPLQVRQPLQCLGPA